MTHSQLLSDAEVDKLDKIHNLTIVFDLDGVICSEEKTFEHAFATSNEKCIQIINHLSTKNTIIIHTARSWAEFTLTQAQLTRWKVEYHTLICGKPIADMVVDDRSIPSVELLMEVL